jgi:hypothetical protein
MTESLIIHQAYKVERLALRCARLRKGEQLVFCPKIKKRIGWDLLKAKAELKVEQDLYTKLCDIRVSSPEIRNFLINNDIHIYS